MFLPFVIVFFYVSLTAQTDSLQQKLVTASKKEKIEIYKELTLKHSFKETEKALNYAEEGLKLVYDKDSENAAFFYFIMGRLHNSQSKHEMALFYYTKTLGIAEKLEYQLGIGNSYQNLGLTYVKTGDYEHALDYFLKALNIFKAEKKENNIVAVMCNIGSLYSSRLNDHVNGLLYYNKALELSEKQGNEKFRANILGSIGEMYKQQKKYAKAKNAIQESIRIADRVKSPTTLISAWGNLSLISIEEKRFKEALQYAKKSLQLSLEIKRTEDISLTYMTLADIYEKLGDTKAVSLHYDKALAAAIESKALPELLGVYKALHEYSGRKKNYKKGYEYLLKFTAIKDSLYTKEKDKQLKEIQAKFDVEGKEKEVQQLTNENRIKVLENERQQTTQIGLIIGLIALTVVVVTLFYGYKNKQKTNKVLGEKNEKISQTLKDREILLKEVHHRVKNNLQIVSSLLRLQHKFGDHKSAAEILQEIQDKIQAMAIIHERLYKSSDLSVINLQTYLDNLLSYFSTSYDLPEQNISISTAVDDINLDMDYLVPCGLIVNEIIANSIKHGFQDDISGHISIEASKNDDKCILTIKDTGIGFPEDFKIGNSTSLGMQLIQGLAKQIKGSVEIASNPGACYTIKFDVTT